MNLKDLDNLQIVMRTRRGQGNVNISVGMSIDEDAPRRARDGRIVGYNAQLDTEDKNGNGILDEGEDTGLDGVFGVDDSLVAGDDANDDYDYRDNQMGTENNGRLDTEDLAGNGFSRYNHYYETTIALDEPDGFEPLYGPWRLYRVSLDTASFRAVGSPKWENIKYVRVWFDGFEEADTMDFFSIEFTGSRWREPTLADIDADSGTARVPDTSEVVWLSQVSRKTNPDYVSPFEPRRDAHGRLEQEAALAFGYRKLRDGRRALVSRVSAQRDDYRDYGQLRAWLHDDGSGIGFLLRVGADSLNYYAFAARVTDGVPVGRGDWYEFVIELDSLPVLKARRDSAGTPGVGFYESGPFRVRGNPSLADIRYLALGIENHDSRPKTGALWFNDLRLSAPRQDPGFGLQASADIRLSDFFSVAASAGYSDPNFRKLSEGQGVKTGGYGTNYGLNLRANLDRLTPASWGVSLPVSYSTTERRELPKFASDWPDYRLSREEAAREEGRSRDESFALENLRKQRSDNPWLNHTVEAMGFSWRHRRGFRNTPLMDDSSFNTGLQWGYSISPNVSIELNEDDELALLPQSIQFGLAEGRNRSVRVSRRSLGDTTFADTTRTVGHGLNTDVSVDYSPLDDLSFEYSVGVERDLLVHEDTLAGFLRVGSEAGRDENLSASYSMDLWDFLSPSVEFDGEYSDERPRGGGLRYEPYRNMGNSGELEFGLSVELSEIADWIRDRNEDAVSRGGKESSDTLPAPVPAGRPGPGILSLFGSAIGVVDPIEFGYGTGRVAELVAVSIDSGAPAPLPFRLGLTSDIDTAIERSSQTVELASSWRASSGLRIKDFRLGAGYDWSRSTNTSIFSATRDFSTSWPDFDFSVNRVHELFKNYATDSRLNGRYRRRYDVGGNVDLEADTLEWYGLTESQTHDLSPLLSWQTTWKQRVTTTVSANYSLTQGRTWLGNSREANSSENRAESRGGRLQASYAFSAPRGLRLPFFRGVRFSSDLRLTWAFDYSYTTRQRRNPEEIVFVHLQDDRAWSTRLTGAYMFSRAIEAGANVGYSNSRAQTGTRTTTTDLDVWVLFRF